MSLTVEVLVDPYVNIADPKRSMDVAYVVDCIEHLDKIARSAKVVPLSKLGIIDPDDTPEKLKYFDPQIGIRTLEALVKVLEDKPERNPADEPEILLEELDYLAGMLKKAAKRKAKFRFMAV